MKNDDIGLYIDIKEKVINTIQKIGLEHYPNEFGGIFIGRYSKDKKKVIIEDTILPQTYKSSKYSFERGAEGLSEVLTKLYSKKVPQLYVGEWHTHPDAQPIPSQTDIIALRQIVGHDEVNISSPVMLIVGLSRESMTLAFYVYFKTKIYNYEIC